MKGRSAQAHRTELETSAASHTPHRFTMSDARRGGRAQSLEARNLLPQPLDLKLQQAILRELVLEGNGSFGPRQRSPVPRAEKPHRIVQTRVQLYSAESRRRVLKASAEARKH